MQELNCLVSCYINGERLIIVGMESSVLDIWDSGEIITNAE